jgi:AcrR family transcriptional regulator
MVLRMAERLSAHDWIDFALQTLARDGFHALKADMLARKLKVSRGSFYWHFAELATFHAQVIARWKETATEAIIADLERHAPAERLDVLLGRAFRHENRLELRMRGWADVNAEAARAVAEVDRRRCGYIERMLIEAGVARPLAATRTELLYWAYLGAALSRSKLVGARLDRAVAELKRIGLGA